MAAGRRVIVPCIRFRCQLPTLLWAETGQAVVVYGPLVSRNMGRVRTKTVKKSARVIIEKYYSKLSSNDFHTNKRVCDEVAILPSKRMRNKVAGFITHLMKRIQRGPVRGISLKLQEEERERRMDFVPEVSAVNTETIEVDQDTKAMLRSIGLGSMPGVVVVQPGERRPYFSRK
jgi:small subunit ribosomal protein S17e